MSGVRKLRELVIPELEAAPLPRQFWTESERAILSKYFGKCNIRSIARYLQKEYPPGRSAEAVKMKAYSMGLRGNKETKRN